MSTLWSLTQEIHENAKAKGWWDNHRSEKEITMLVVSEVAEATEEVRNKKPALYFVNEGQDVEINNIQDFPEGFKPEGESVELADAFIRALDYAGHINLNLNGELPGFDHIREGDSDVELNDIVKWYDPVPEYDYFREASPLEAHWEIVKPIYVCSLIEKALMLHILNIARYFKHKGWDLDEVVNLKVAYNLKRPYRHGGKAY